MNHREPLPETRSPDLTRRVWVWVCYLALFALSVPWYLPAEGPPELWFGIPHWVVLSLGACVAIAMFTALVVLRLWRGPGDDS